MLRHTAMTKRQAFLWLWRKDSEAKWYWFRCFIKGADLKEDVAINLQCFGVVKNA